VTIPTVSLRADDATELVELLTFVADLCASDASSVDQALGHFLGAGGYGSSDLRGDVIRLADLLANALGFADSQMEKTS
jgi:hypothetical protein